MLRRPAVLAVVASSLLTACTTDRAVSSAPPPAVDAGMQHVHGLGVDPADGTLYAATHSGLFRIPEDGDAERVADRFQDTMGFTVAGPRTFLGSGHPDPRTDPGFPTRLGLVRSADAGGSWEIVSLGGEADFHALRAAHGSVYGWDAGTGRLMVSTDDGRTWENRSTLDLRDFVVDPGNPDVLLATTERGVQSSSDGGTTWSPLPGTPTLAVLAWPTAASLYGVAPDGSVHRSTDGGATWTRQGSVDGAPEALYAEQRDGVERVYVAVSPATILVSTDGGGSFTARYPD